MKGACEHWLWAYGTEHRGMNESFPSVVPREMIRTSGYNQAPRWVPRSTEMDPICFMLPEGVLQRKRGWFDRGHPANGRGAMRCFSRRLGQMTAHRLPCGMAARWLHNSILNKRLASVFGFINGFVRRMRPWGRERSVLRLKMVTKLHLETKPPDAQSRPPSYYLSKFLIHTVC